nr:hypothetical protein Iba_chr13cCG3620 [Ipomoea batatas]
MRPLSRGVLSKVRKCTLAVQRKEVKRASAERGWSNNLYPVRLFERRYPHLGIWRAANSQERELLRPSPSSNSYESLRVYPQRGHRGSFGAQENHYDRRRTLINVMSDVHPNVAPN